MVHKISLLIWVALLHPADATATAKYLPQPHVRTQEWRLREKQLKAKVSRPLPCRTMLGEAIGVASWACGCSIGAAAFTSSPRAQIESSPYSIEVITLGGARRSMTVVCLPSRLSMKGEGFYV